MTALADAQKRFNTFNGLWIRNRQPILKQAFNLSVKASSDINISFGKLLVFGLKTKESADRP